jgi:hypothetical protein
MVDLEHVLRFKVEAYENPVWFACTIECACHMRNVEGS